MTRSTAPTPPPSDRGPVHVVHVLGGTSPGFGPAPPSAVTCVQLGSLAHGLVAHGVRISLHAPPEAEAVCQVTEAGAQFAPARARTEPEAVLALRTALAGADLVHAHGLRAATLACLARDLAGPPRMPLVVSWHRREAVRGAREGVLRMLERRVARAASVVLCGTSGLVDLARRRGARDARLAQPAMPTSPPPAGGPVVDHARGAKTRAEIGAVDRPLLLSVGRLEARYGYGTVLTAARDWRRLEPPPLVAVAGDGPERSSLQAAIDAEELPVSLLGCRGDAFELLGVADLALLPEGGAAGTAVFAQEALQAGVPVVGAAEDGVPELVGGAGVLTRPGEADELAEAVTGLLARPGRLAGIAAACSERVAAQPTREQTVAHVLSVYDELLIGAAATR